MKAIPNRSSRARREKCCLCLLILLAVTAVGCRGSSETADGHSGAEAPVRIAAIHPQRKDLERRVEQPGQIAAQEETPLYARVPGYVQSVAVDIGDKIKEGQTLAVLYVPELEKGLKQKESMHEQAVSQVDQSDAAVEVARAAIDTAESKIAMAEAAVTKAQADVDRWQSEYDRIYKLTETSAINQKVADETLNQLRAAQSTRQEAEANVKSVQAMLTEAKAKHQAALADAKAARSRVDVAAADVAQSKTMVDYAVIKAPYDGVVTERDIHTGFYVQPATTGRDQPLFVVAHSDTVRVVVYVTEADAGFVHPGDPASVRLPALDNKTFEAAVTRTALVLDEASRTLRTEIELSNPEGQLHPGMYCYVTIVVKKQPDAIVIPVSAVMYDQGQPMCAAIENGRIVRKPVGLGMKAGNEVEVISGLTTSDLIAPRTPESYRNGQLAELTN